MVAAWLKKLCPPNRSFPRGVPPSPGQRYCSIAALIVLRSGQSVICAENVHNLHNIRLSIFIACHHRCFTRCTLQALGKILTINWTEWSSQLLFLTYDYFRQRYLSVFCILCFMSKVIWEASKSVYARNQIHNWISSQISKLLVKFKWKKGSLEYWPSNSKYTKRIWIIIAQEQLQILNCNCAVVTV